MSTKAPADGDLLSGPQRAAVLLAQLDERRAQEVLRLMSESEVIRIMQEVASLPVVDPGAIEAVVGRFVDEIATLHSLRQGGPAVARALLEERVGPERAGELLPELLQQGGHRQSLQFLQQVDPAVLASVLGEEHPQLAALVLTHLTAGFAALVLKQLPSELRTDLVRRMATMNKVWPEAVDAIVAVLDSKLSALMTGQADSVSVGGVSALVNILNSSPRSVEKQLLTEFEQSDPELAEELRSLLFSFEDVLALDDLTLQKVLRQISPKELALALRSSDDATREKFTKNMSERAGADLVEEIDTLGPTRASMIDNAQAQIAKAVRNLEAAGEIVLLRDDEELV